MAGEQLTVTFEPEVAEAAARGAEREGVSLSVWLERLAREAAISAEEAHARRIEENRAEARRIQEEFRFTPEELEETDRLLDALGIGRRAG
jgi:hypothetical protein